MGEVWLLIEEEIVSWDRISLVKIAEMTTMDLEDCMNLVDKGMTGFERIDSSFERALTVGEILSNSTACYRETICERKHQQI